MIMPNELASKSLKYKKFQTEILLSSCLHKEELISKITSCSTILEYPTKQAQDNFHKLFHPLYNYKIDNYDEVEAEYISIFNINSTKLKCVPYASWWIDGKFYGKTLDNIENFYKSCGYEFENETIKLPADHIAILLRFLAILLDEKRYDKIDDFIPYLQWLDKFTKSLENATKMEIFHIAGNIAVSSIYKYKEVAHG